MQKTPSGSGWMPPALTVKVVPIEGRELAAAAIVSGARTVALMVRPLTAVRSVEPVSGVPVPRE